MKKVVIVIPAFNEEKSIGKVVRSIPKLEDMEVDILVVDDGSEDNTREEAIKAGAKVISFPGNRGLVNVFNKGLEYALRSGADFILTMDGDGQHDPKEIPKLLKPLLENRADVVIGSRFIRDYRHPSLLKHFGNMAFSRIISILTSQKITDAQSGFRAFTREVAEKINIRMGQTYTQQMIIQAAYYKFKIVEVPISVRERIHGRSKLVRNPLSFAYNAWKLLITIIAIYYPIKFFGLFGILLILSGSIIGLILPHNDVLSSLIISTGIQFILFGILFEIVKNK